MNKNVTIYSLVLIIAVSVAYYAGMKTMESPFTDKDMESAKVMMKAQSASIEKMSAMMSESGMMMKEKVSVNQLLG